MKLIIDVPNEVLKSRHYCQYFGVWSTKLTETIENGKPYEERPQGEWINESISFGCGDTECSNCHEKAEMIVKDTGWGYDYSSYNFCPNCGADMRGGVE